MREPALRIIESLAGVDPLVWDALVNDNPTLRHAFLQSLIDSGCTTAANGWQPQFLTMWERPASPGGDERLCGAVPLYLKGHSYGEYVFDWAWAEAYQRNGLAYYPKLVAAVPFTPCTGTRLLARTVAERKLLVTGLLNLAEQNHVSSLHILFAGESEHSVLCNAGMMSRTSIQFHWRNTGYSNFDEFLAAMNHDKRKKIRQERRRVSAAGITFRRVTGAEITEADWDFFAGCYERTYREHHSTPYLNRAFFGMLGQRMAENILLVIAERSGTPVASAMNLFNSETLFGRYWGSHEYHSGLHFETCYYQALEFCIDRGIKKFEGGAQGEHKLARGFLPEKCHSAHWLKHPRFADAVETFLRRETGGIEQYVNELESSSPFKDC